MHITVAMHLNRYAVARVSRKSVHELSRKKKETKNDQKCWCHFVFSLLSGISTVLSRVRFSNWHFPYILIFIGASNLLVRLLILLAPWGLRFACDFGIFRNVASLFSSFLAFSVSTLQTHVCLKRHANDTTMQHKKTQKYCVKLQHCVWVFLTLLFSSLFQSPAEKSNPTRTWLCVRLHNKQLLHLNNIRDKIVKMFAFNQNKNKNEPVQFESIRQKLCAKKRGNKKRKIPLVVYRN